MDNEQPVDRKTFWENRDSKLGTQTDIALAKLWNVEVHIVRARRRKLKIELPKKNGEKRKPHDKLNQAELKELWESVDPVLGSKPDHKIAKDFDVTTYRISSRRKELGIPSWRKTQLQG
ncbi:TPA: hypothetical protein ACF35C_004126 [Vibrio parahaemolyticus]|uniref:hypothetical protein n=1 Tax=Vibrio diabolicus TaxID=50719 RepID=UPI002493E9A4|nr:hypothetical protein [Vibrio diabolicus]